MSRPLVCVTVTAPTTAELREAARCRRRRRPGRAAARHGERSGRGGRACRPAAAGDRHLPAAWEGGQFKGSEEERRRLLGEALALGAEYVDVEWRARLRRSDRADRRPPDRAVVARFRRRCRATSPASPARCARPAPRSSRSRPRRTASATAFRCWTSARRIGRDGGHGADRAWATAGWPRACLPAASDPPGPTPGDLRDVGQLTPATLLDDYRFRSISDVDRGLRSGRLAGRAFGLAGDAQRRVRGDRASTPCICRCRPRMPTTSSPSPARSA